MQLESKVPFIYMHIHESGEIHFSITENCLHTVGKHCIERASIFRPDSDCSPVALPSCHPATCASDADQHAYA